jgi:flagellar biosynthetic protein FliR
MPGNLSLSAATLYGFLLVLARLSGALVFVPLPGIKSAPEPARIAVSLAMTLSLISRWPAVDPAITPGTLAAWVVSEAALGLVIGVSVAIVLEAFNVAAQILGLQAGYAYASTIDPNSDADSGVLTVFAQLIAGMLFFALGLDREVMRLFAGSLERIPPGSFLPDRTTADTVIRLGASLFSTGARLALPVVALLILVDVALALLGRINQQLQLLALAFPVKMLISLVMLGWLAALFPRILTELSGYIWTLLRRIGI